MAFYVDWKPEYSVGIEVVDTDHKKLFALCNELQKAIERKAVKEELGKIIDELVKYGEVHFRHEEVLFATHQYPKRAAHIARHEEFALVIHDFRKRWVDGDLIMGSELLGHIRAWLISHILTEDLEFAPFLKEKGCK